MKKIAWIALLSFVCVMLAGCIITARPTIPPPPLRKEVRIVKPGPDYIWISGHWRWVGGKYVWVKSYWVKERRGKVWVQGHWEKRSRRWIWVKGHWQRKRL